MLYKPAASVTALVATPVLTSVVVTFAPGTAAPVGSLTYPLMAPQVACARPLVAEKDTHTKPAKTIPSILFMAISSTLEKYAAGVSTGAVDLSRRESPGTRNSLVAKFFVTDRAFRESQVQNWAK